jgi:septal ring factor EnvC (AmiA/AmiB activator)
VSNDRTTEIINYLSAISHDVGELRREVGELRAEVKQLSERVDRLEARVAQVEARLERVEREQRNQGRRLARIEACSSPPGPTWTNWTSA